MAKTDRSASSLLYGLLRRINIHPGYFIVPALLAFLAASLEGVSMSLLIPLLTGFLTKDYSFVTSVPGLSTILLWLPSAVSLRDRNLFIVLISLFVLIIVLKNIIRYAGSSSMAYLSTRALHHLRKALFAAYLRLNKQFFDQTNIGHHSTVLSQYTIFGLKPLMTLDRCMQGILSLLVSLIIMAFISWKLTLLTLPLFFLVHYVVRRRIDRMRVYAKHITMTTADLNKQVIEILSSIPLVKANNMEEEEQVFFTALSDRRSVMEFRLQAIQQVIHPLQEVISMLSVLVLVIVMLSLLIQEGQAASAPSFIVYFYLIINAANRFGAISGMRTELATAHAPLLEIQQVFDSAAAHTIPEGTKEFPGLKSQIEYKDVHFTYTDTPILRGLSMTIEKGKMTAIVGPTGSGKTTVISLLLRYYDCLPNSILIDGTDIREYSSSSIRKHIAFVSQDTLLLNCSLKDNITYGHVEQVSPERLNTVVRNARLDEFVAQLPQGLDTLIGDRGVKLSGGEKQRVSIARALLKRADILILDEATSALDSKTERLIQEAIDEAIRDRTAIVIAHRLSTIKHADNIVVIDEGRCLEQGKLEALLEKKGKFYELWQEQKFS